MGFSYKAMKHLETIATSLAIALALTAIARAGGIVSSNNPYAPISHRNIFGLIQASSAIPALPAKPEETPFKIHCSGLTSILGRWQVLFSVSGPGKFPANQAGGMSYILSEGEQQDDIKVMHIDPTAFLIVFDNHGIIQRIHLDEKPKAEKPRRFQTPSQILFQMEHPNGD